MIAQGCRIVPRSLGFVLARRKMRGSPLHYDSAFAAMFGKHFEWQVMGAGVRDPGSTVAPACRR
jgi:hypothetical protein